MKARARAYLYLVGATAIWGAAGPIIKFTLNGIDPLPFLTYRFTIAATFSICFFLYKIFKGKRFRYLRANFPLALIYGFIAVPVATGLLFFGLDKSTVLDMALIGIAGPILVTLGGAFFFHDRITRREKIGIAIVLLGVVLNSISPILGSSSLKFTGNVLLAAFLLADAGSILLAKRAVKKKINASNLASLGFIVGAIAMTPIALVSEGPGNLVNTIAALPFEYHLGVWYMALLSGSLAYFMYVRGMRTIEVSEAVLFNYLQPIFTIPLAVFWLEEKVSFFFIIGAVIIATGLIIAQSKKKRYNHA